jgi:tRNA threonylcarbamoyladenosine biosynthesis protein TsaE
VKSERAFEFRLRDAVETIQCGRRLAEFLQPNDVIALCGPLGAGKTCLTKGIVEGLGAASSDVTSPTFVLANEYSARLHIYHLDAYRISGIEELESIGFVEMCDSGGVVIVEWADRVSEAIAEKSVWVRLDYAKSGRTVSIRAPSDRENALRIRLSHGSRATDEVDLTDPPTRAFASDCGDKHM